MDSIAAPVQDIQYPTITVCQDENKPPDNWALLELIFNNFAFECEYSTYYGLPPCNSTSKIRSDFKFLIETVLSMIRGLMKQPEFRGNSFSVLSGDVEELVEKIAVSLTNGEVKFGDLSNLPNMYFGVKSDLETILKQTINETDDEYIGFYFYYATQEPPINCTSKQCQEYLGSAWSIVQTLAEVTLVQPNLPFGSIFALQVAPKTAQMASQELPKLQKAFKDLSRGPKLVPKRLPGGPKRLPRGVKRLPKGPQEGPKRP